MDEALRHVAPQLPLEHVELLGEQSRRPAGGALPLEPPERLDRVAGGQLGEAYIHGMNGIAEGVRQIRGTSVNPVDGVEHLVVTAGTGVPTSGLVLSR